GEHTAAQRRSIEISSRIDYELILRQSPIASIHTGKCMQDRLDVCSAAVWAELVDDSTTGISVAWRTAVCRRAINISGTIQHHSGFWLCAVAATRAAAAEGIDDSF